MENKYVVGFYGGELLDGISVGDYMICRIKGITLYAEVPLTGTEWDNSDDPDIPFRFSEYAYPILKQDIIGQAKKNGIDPNELVFIWD